MKGIKPEVWMIPAVLVLSGAAAVVVFSPGAEKKKDFIFPPSGGRAVADSAGYGSGLPDSAAEINGAPSGLELAQAKTRMQEEARRQAEASADGGSSGAKGDLSLSAAGKERGGGSHSAHVHAPGHGHGHGNEGKVSPFTGQRAGVDRVEGAAQDPRRGLASGTAGGGSGWQDDGRGATAAGGAESIEMRSEKLDAEIAHAESMASEGSSWNDGEELSVTRDDGTVGKLGSTFFAKVPDKEIPMGVKAIVTVLKTKNVSGGKLVKFSDDSEILFPPGTTGNTLNACEQVVFTAKTIKDGQKVPAGKQLSVIDKESNAEGSMLTFSDGSQISYRQDMPGHKLKDGDAVVQVPERYGKFIVVTANKKVSENVNEVSFNDGSKMRYGAEDFGYRYKVDDHAILLPEAEGAQSGRIDKKGVTVTKTNKDEEGNRVTFSDNTEMYFSSAEDGYNYEKGKSVSLVADPHCKQVTVTKTTMVNGGKLVTFSDATQIFYAPERQGYNYAPGQGVVVDRNGHQVSIQDGGHHHASGIGPGDLAPSGAAQPHH